jgi:hypothetical protein
MELGEYAGLLKNGVYRKEFEKDMQGFASKIQVKLAAIEERFKMHLRRHNVSFDERSRKDVLRAIRELLKRG